MIRAPSLHLAGVVCCPDLMRVRSEIADDRAHSFSAIGGE